MKNQFLKILGFDWGRGAIPKRPTCVSKRDACLRFQQMLPEYVWNDAVLECNSFTSKEVKTLLSGAAVDGKEVFEQEQILNLAAAARELLEKVRIGSFVSNKDTFVAIHRLVARNEALEWGVFRGEGDEKNFTPSVALGEKGYHDPLPTKPNAPELNVVFERALPVFNNLPPLERGLSFFLFGALRQFFFDGNKRTSRLMMNGILMSHGLDAISIPAAKAELFNKTMVNFYSTRDATPMMKFMLGCGLDLVEQHEVKNVVSPAATRRQAGISRP